MAITLPDPITREEKYLAALAGMDVNTPEPVSRREVYLSAAVEGGGGGSYKEKEVVIEDDANPEITALESTRYLVVEECETLSFTPSATGTCEVVFISGATPTVLTLPEGVLFPEWFDPDDLEANRLYNIIITDALLGAVISYPYTAE